MPHKYTDENFEYWFKLNLMVLNLLSASVTLTKKPFN